MLTHPIKPNLAVATVSVRKAERNMISMSIINSIRQLRKEGYSVSDIARKASVSRDTVYKYLNKDDFSPKIPETRQRKSKLDPYRTIIERWLDEDLLTWKKQRHTSRRIWQRLRDEYGFDGSETTVARYVRSIKDERRLPTDQFLDLVWTPGEAQADFGELDLYLNLVKRRLSYFVLSFPYSNVGFAQIFPAENAECVCQALKQIFEYIGGVPTRIVFDNATGVGRRTCEAVRTTELFGRFAAHYDFAYSFCNPNAGHEKGNVEKKVGFIRTNLFVPLPNVMNIYSYNKTLLKRCDELAKRQHWKRGEVERELFVEDQFALIGLPAKSFDVVRYVKAKANKQGKISVDGPHHYSTDPTLAGRELTIAMRAYEIEVFDADAVSVCKHSRSYGSVPTDSTDPASQLALLSIKANAWQNSQVRASLSDDVRTYMDSLENADLKAEIRLLRDEAARSGWAATRQAVELAYAATGRIDSASVAVAAARIAVDDAISYDEPIDLSEYDAAFKREA